MIFVVVVVVIEFVLNCAVGDRLWLDWIGLDRLRLGRGRLAIGSRSTRRKSKRGTRKGRENRENKTGMKEYSHILNGVLLGTRAVFIIAFGGLEDSTVFGQNFQRQHQAV